MKDNNDKQIVSISVDGSQQLEALFNFASIGIVVTNHNGEILNFNKFAENQFGYTKEEIVGKRVEVLLPQAIHSRHVNYRHQYYEHPEPRVMGHGRDLYATNKNGGTFPVEVSLSHYKIGNETFVIAFVIDITVRKKQESLVLDQKKELERVTTEIREMNSELEQKIDDRTKMLREALVELEKSKEELSEAYENEKELSELKSRFVTMASHEFRTPLSTILSSAYLLEKYTEQLPDEKINKHILRIKAAVGGMKSILEDFLSLGKLEEGRVKVQMEKTEAVTVIEIIRNVIQEMDGMLKTGQHIQLNDSIYNDVLVDKQLLKNILINLVSNAIKFTQEHSSINISCDLSDVDLIIAIRDNGIGISQEDQEHLFERFFRAKNAANIQGTGLGLHIVAKYLELMNGRIEIKSKLEEGSVFTIYIPQN
ncbi:PAS domain S-box protein [Panacibacter ginsenosidivorans]|uniref:histidine kinase n=1 Tax=Panacibacter ginsenosidivorans TaxID=1813871 RepID=A0A5B8V2M8_9BACT|nr:PAS domain-containing sensor histidine kinase [Panacibacter ginsenosidivorans]QEC65767.1 PAS domain S-box protein [Panacibacter ginsenosidivorans]QEC70076.1 PAS domain S-box protein [Panacibacter ginsenosidivorans]